MGVFRPNSDGEVCTTGLGAGTTIRLAFMFVWAIVNSFDELVVFVNFKSSAGGAYRRGYGQNCGQRLEIFARSKVFACIQLTPKSQRRGSVPYRSLRCELRDGQNLEVFDGANADPANNGCFSDDPYGGETTIGF
jgi:hypothetical protein